MEDFIVIGAGSAGSVLANRLSTDARVTLLEAGPVDHRWDYRLHMPAALSHVLASKWYNWDYYSEPEPGLDDRRLYCPRGKVLGGSSSINGMIFVRGNHGDFDRWASEYGLDDWDFDACLPFFKKSESIQFEGDEFRGHEGPLPLTRCDEKSPLVNAWLGAGVEAGHRLSDDFNGRNQEGVGLFDRSVYRGMRQNTSRTYLDPARNRGNLSVVNTTLVTRIIVEHGRATGVEILRGGHREILKAGEIILCAGAINSPHLLMLSGIGPQSELQEKNIEVINHLPGVGQNLQDHLEIYVQYECKQPVSLYPFSRWYRMPDIGLMWLLLKKGVAASNQFEAGAFLKSRPELAYPDLQYHFLPIAMDYDGKSQVKGHGFQFHVGPMKPTSRGEIRLRSANPADAPVIRFNYNTTDEDREVMRQGIRLGHEIVSQPAFEEFTGHQIQSYGQTDESLDRFISRRAESAYHPSGTCRMSNDDSAVVNNRGQVHGVQCLRIVDASIMPEITNGNLNAPVIMMAEKISADILGR
jgi:choline dehydrogenase